MSKSIRLQDPQPSREQLREQIRQTIQDAQQAAQQAAQEAGRDVRRERIVIPAAPGAPAAPGVTIVRPWNATIPPEAERISIAFFVCLALVIIGLPIVRAIARRIERGTPIAAPIPTEVRNQLQHISQSVEAIAIEVERISEGQRFTTKLLSDNNRELTSIPARSPSEGSGRA